MLQDSSDKFSYISVIYGDHPLNETDCTYIQEKPVRALEGEMFTHLNLHVLASIIGDQRRSIEQTVFFISKLI
jgi:hypothetical protein